MIIFDDAEFSARLIKGEIPKCRYRNSVLRSCAKMVSVGAYGFDEMLEALMEYNPDFNIDDALFASYVTARGEDYQAKYHEVRFGINELKNIYKLPKKSERKYYLAQLFCFKYFETHRIRLAGREFKRIAGICPDHHSLTDLHLGRGITVRRETTYKYIKKNYRNEKPYTYYYPLEKMGKVVFTYRYEGDCFMLPAIEWNSNIKTLWELCEEARQYNL